MPRVLDECDFNTVGIHLEADLVQSDGRNQKKSAKTRMPDSGKLTLVRVENAGKKGINLVFSQSEQEQRWLLEHTSVMEFLALLFGGRMRKGRRIEFDKAELVIEPPPAGSDNPQLCMALGALEVCAPLSQATVKAMRADLERVAKRPG